MLQRHLQLHNTSLLSLPYQCYHFPISDHLYNNNSSPTPSSLTTTFIATFFSIPFLLSYSILYSPLIHVPSLQRYNNHCFTISTLLSLIIRPLSYHQYLSMTTASLSSHILFLASSYQYFLYHYRFIIITNIDILIIIFFN